MKQKIALTVLALSGLTACSTGALQAMKPEQKISGTVTRGLIEPHRVEVNLDGKSYRGEWRIDSPTKEQRAATSLPHRRHVGQVRSTLVADDGSKLDCIWQTHSGAAEGSCSGNGHDYPLILK